MPRLRPGPRVLGEVFGYTVGMHEAAVTEPQPQVDDGPRSPANRFVLVTHFVAYVVLPGLVANAHPSSAAHGTQVSQQ